MTMGRNYLLRAAATTLAVAMLGSTLLLTGCADQVKLTSTAEGFVSNDKVTYQAAPTCYVPAGLGMVCGSLDGAADFGVELYTIPGADPSEWLATEAGDVFYADNLTLPTLTEMAPTMVEVYTNTEIMAKSTEIIDPSVVAGLVAACAEDKALDERVILSPGQANHCVRFCSEQYPSIQYELYHVQYKGDYYLYDRAHKKYYLIGKEIYDALYTRPTTGGAGAGAAETSETGK